MAKDCNVTFSVSSAVLRNKWSTSENTACYSTYFVRNESSSSQKIKVSISKNSDPVFRICKGGEESSIAAGLSMQVVLEYNPKDYCEHQGELEVCVNGHLATLIPIKSVLPFASLKTDTSQLDFGVQVNEHQIVQKYFEIINSGELAGCFHTQSSLPSCLSLSLLNGKVEPKQSLKIQVKLLCNQAGDIDEHVWLTFDNKETSTVSIHIKCSIIERLLKVFTVDDPEMQINKLSYDFVYYGSVATKKVILYNDSPVSSDFVITVDEKMSECVNKNKGLAVALTAYEIGGGNHGDITSHLDSIFKIFPQKGTLCPYERCMVKFIFAPKTFVNDKGWSHSKVIPQQKDYNILVKFTIANKIVTNCNEECKIVALTASAISVDIKVIPDETIDFGCCTNGEKIIRDIKIMNCSTALPLKFKCQDLAHYSCHPSCGEISKETSVVLKLYFEPKQLGFHNFHFFVHFWGPELKMLRKNASIHTMVTSFKGHCVSGVISKPASDNLLIPRVAKLNNLPSSVRPWTSSTNYVSEFTRIPRYSYCDRDYSYLPQEEVARLNHRQVYESYFREKQSERLWREKERKLTTNSNLDDDPAMQVEYTSHTNGLERTNCDGESRLIKELNSNNTLEYCENSFFDNINDFKKAIPPDKLSLIVVEPSTLKFGNIVVNSTVLKEICMRNFTCNSVGIKLEINCPQLQCSAHPLKRTSGLILSPRSYTKVQFSLRPTEAGFIEGNLKMTLNQCHTYNFPVYAKIEELSLELSSKTIVLMEQCSEYTNSGFWGVVQVNNVHDVPIKFKWLPKNGAKDDNFFPLQSSGVIPHNANMMCGFVYLPSFESPCFSEYLLNVSNTDSCDYKKVCASLLLEAKFQKSQCSIEHRRILFGLIPLNLISSQFTSIKNRSESQAFFKIAELRSDLNIEVYPSMGCIPGGGSIELELKLCPATIGCFDVKVCIHVRSSKPLYVRLSGSVEHPKITVSKEVFDFGGVLCGSKATIPYTITNEGSCQAQLTFDFSYLHDFRLMPPINSQDSCIDNNFKEQNNNMTLLRLSSHSSMHCMLEFKPSEIAAYDFFLTVLVNGMKPPIPPASPWPPSNTHSLISVANKSDTSFSNTPIRRVMATVLQSPLLIVNSTVEFLVSSMGSGDVTHYKFITLMNVGNGPLSWSLDIPRYNEILGKTLKFTHPSTEDILDFNQLKKPTSLDPGEKYKLGIKCSTEFQPGSLSVSIPVLLNNVLSPYCELSLSVTYPTGSIIIKPSYIALQPVPLGVTTCAEFSIVMDGFLSTVDIDVLLPVCEDCTHLTVNFSEDTHVTKDLKAEVLCTLEFCSTKSVSKNDFITVIEKNTRTECKIPISIAADNSMFTVYDFFSHHLETSVIKVNEDGIPMFHYQSHSLRSPPSTTSILSSDGTLMSGFKYGQMYCQDCVNATCCWIASYGGIGVRCLKSPTDFCSKVKDGSENSAQKQRSRVNTSKGMLVDMLTHICGRVPPGIPPSLPLCSTVIENILQLYSTYDIVLTFLRNQGAILPSVTPEVLLDYKDYLHWVANAKYKAKDEEEFKARSTQAWTSLLMQIIKVLVLPSLLKTEQEIGNKDKLLSSVSNIYSIWERRLLLWLNYHYKLHQEILLNSKGSLAEVVNFDVDLMDSSVLSCVLYSYCPFLRHSHFSKLFYEPYTPEQCAHNAIIIIDALRHIGITYNIQQSDICSPNPIFMLLLSSHLYFVLPAYKPMDSIKFSAVLSKNDEVKIKITNRNSKDMTYLVLIRGEHARNFTAPQSVLVAGHTSNEIAINFCCNSLLPAKANIFLIPRSKQFSASVLAYFMFGSSTGATPKVQKKISTPLYEPKTLDLPVTSPFQTKGMFKVLLFESENLSSLNFNEGKPNRGHNIAKSSFISISNFQKRSDDGINCFHVNENIVNMQPGSNTVITVQFIPLKLTPRHCFVVLSNPELGDVVFSITAFVNAPTPLLPEILQKHQSTVVNKETRTLHLNTTSKVKIEERVILHSCNMALENALLEISKWELSAQDLKRRLLTESLHYAALSNGVSKIHINDFLKICDIDSKEVIMFSIDRSDNKHFTMPNIVNVPTTGNVEFPIWFHADTEGQYECRVLLKSGYDLRTIFIEATVSSEETITVIEFHTQAIQPLMQNIPVVNPSTVDWSLVATISSSQFTGPSNLNAPALSTTCYPLTFCPQMEGNSESELILLNKSDCSKHIFKLCGIAERPLARDKIKLQAKVGQRLTHIIHVPNLKERTVMFIVESDLDFISGPSEVSIGGNDIIDYPLTIQPRCHGNFSGALMFIAKATNYTMNPEPTALSPYHIWFQVECEVDYAPPDSFHSMECPVFSSKLLELPVENPHDSKITLMVILEGDYLFGPKELFLESFQKSIYVATFSPLTVGISTGRIMFEGSKEGEFWHEVKLEGLSPKPVQLPLMECEVGRNCHEVITINNPLDTPVHFTCNNSNTCHYTVSGLADGCVTVPSKSKVDITVFFYPSLIGSDGHEAHLLFMSYEFGDQVFAIEGNGLLPSCMDATTIYAGINSASVYIIKFVNPLKFPVHICVLLKGSDSKLFFLLHKQSNHIIIQRGGSVDIPVMFAPEKMYRHSVIISIIANSSEVKQNLQWDYPIYGQPELRLSSKDNALKIACHAKLQVEQIVEVTLMRSLKSSNEICFSKLDDVPPINSKICNQYNCKMKCNGLVSSLTHQSVYANLLGQRTSNENEKESILVLKVGFFPPKAFRSLCELIITNNEGGLWVLPMNLRALPSSPDDTITVEASGLNKEARVSFKLSSPTPHSIPYSAYLSLNSDSEISVSPTKGFLEPNGTLFLVIYKPTMYGKEHHAKFIIQCDITEWSYEIVGKLPTYSH